MSYMLVYVCTCVSVEVCINKRKQDKLVYRQVYACASVWYAGTCTMCVCVQLYTKERCASNRKYGQCVQTTCNRIHNALVHSKVPCQRGTSVHVHIKAKKHQVYDKHHGRVSTSSFQTVHDQGASRPSVLITFSMMNHVHVYILCVCACVFMCKCGGVHQQENTWRVSVQTSVCLCNYVICWYMYNVCMCAAVHKGKVCFK